MKKSKKLLALALAAVSVFTTTACGEKDAQTGSKDSAEVIWKIGTIGPTTGGAAVYGQAVKTGAQIAVEEINAAGGINGIKIEYSFEDDENNAEKSVNAYNSLKDWGMDVLLGAVTTGSSIAVSAEAAADNMFMITPSGSSTEIIEDKDNVFQVCFTDPNQGQGSAQYIGENNIAKKVAVIYDSSNAYSVGIFEKFTAEAQKYSFEIVSAEAFTSDSNTDFSVQLQKAKNAEADLLFLPIYCEQSALILTQANAMGYKPVIFSCDGMDGILALDNFDVALAEDVILLTPFVADATDDATVNFVTKYEDIAGETPNQFAADAYDGIYILKAAIEEAKVTPDMSVSDICEALKQVMVNLKIDGLTGLDMTWKDSGEVSKSPKAMVIKDGVYVSY